MTALVMAHATTTDDGPPGNTLAGLERCAADGIRAVELDVIAIDGNLLLGHPPIDSQQHAEMAGPALAAAARFDQIMLDLKNPASARLGAGLVRNLGLTNVVFASSEVRDLAGVRAVLPRAVTSLSIPGDRPVLTRRTWPRFGVNAYILTMKLILPIIVTYKIARHKPSQLTLYHRIASRVAIAAARLQHCPVYVWTVDGPCEARRLVDAGAAGLITNKPLLLLDQLERRAGRS